MSKRGDLEAKILAAAYAARAELGYAAALEMLRNAVRELENKEWSGPGGR